MRVVGYICGCNVLPKNLCTGNLTAICLPVKFLWNLSMVKVSVSDPFLIMVSTFRYLPTNRTMFRAGGKNGR